MKSLNVFNFSSFVTGFTQKGEEFYLDFNDYELVKDKTWHIDDSGYVRSRINGKLIRMHRLIMDCPDSMIIDHISGSLSRNDNRRNNIRICKRSDNNKNMNVSSVYFEKHAKKWRARIEVDLKRIHLGYFDSIDEAMAVRIDAEKRYYGKFAQKR